MIRTDGGVDGKTDFGPPASDLPSLFSDLWRHAGCGVRGVPGIGFMPEPEWSRSNRWLTVVLIEPGDFGASREQVRLALEGENIEARPVWKPMHLQPVFSGAKRSKLKARSGTQISQGTQMNGREARLPTSDFRPPTSCRVVGGEVAEDLFNRGLCLPSGTGMTSSDLDRVVETVLNCRR